MGRGKRRRFRNRGRRKVLNLWWNGYIRWHYPELGPRGCFEDLLRHLLGAEYTAPELHADDLIFRAETGADAEAAARGGAHVCAIPDWAGDET